MAYFNRTGREGRSRPRPYPLSGHSRKRRWPGYTGGIAVYARRPRTNGRDFGTDGRECRLSRAEEMPTLTHS
jgi:hypothetical protein